jgi:hypothetical protein
MKQLYVCIDGGLVKPETHGLACLSDCCDDCEHGGEGWCKAPGGLDNDQMEFKKSALFAKE